MPKLVFNLAALLALAAGGIAAARPEPNVYDLNGLPLSQEIRDDIEPYLESLQQPAALKHCTPEELEFLAVSIVLSVTYWFADGGGGAPWSAEEASRIEALRERWEALGGDAGTVSDRCEAFDRSLQ